MSDSDLIRYREEKRILDSEKGIHINSAQEGHMANFIGLLLLSILGRVLLEKGCLSSRSSLRLTVDRTATEEGKWPPGKASSFEQFANPICRRRLYSMMETGIHFITGCEPVKPGRRRICERGGNGFS